MKDLLFKAFPNVNFRSYQETGIEFLLKYRRTLLADVMGLGKTRTAAASSFLLYPDGYNQIITCSKSALLPWQLELEEQFPEHCENLFVLEGTPPQRQKILDRFYKRRGHKSTILLTSFGVLHQDFDKIPKNWHHLQVDEAHKIMNIKTAGFKNIKKLQPTTATLMTGTPADRGPQDMFAYLNLLYPDQYSSFYAFQGRYCWMEKGMFGMENWGPKNIPELKQRLSTIMIRRTKKDVANELPPKLRLYLPCTLNADQVKPYKEFNANMIMSLQQNNFCLSPTSLTTTLRLRQFCICPKYFDSSLSMGAGIDTVIQHILDNGITHPVILCPFPSLFPLMQEYLKDKLKRNILILRGGMESKDVRKVIKTEFEPSQSACILLSIKFAQSFDLTKSCTGYMLGYEYRLMDNEQAEDRLHRLSSKEPVTIYYVNHRLPDGSRTEDSNIISILNKKASDTMFLNEPYVMKELFMFDQNKI